MTYTSLLRIVDENLDRLAEGLRVLEDLARMLLNDTALTSQLKDLRHNLIHSDLVFNLELLKSRESYLDIGKKLEVAGENPFQDLTLIALANARRIQEALRVLEELSKLPELSAKLDSNQFKSARFAIYSIEKELVPRLSRQNQSRLIKGLYVIVDTQFLGDRNPPDISLQLIQSGVKIIQLRAKNLEKKPLLAMAEKIQGLCRQNQVLFIVNDQLDIALAIKADGLHIGQSDLPAAIARWLLPFGTLLGVSVATVEEAQEAEAAGADYLGVGAIFPTSTKAVEETLGLERIRQIRAVTTLPLAAIGGINSNNILDVLRAGADSACVIGAVLGSPDVVVAARHLIKIIEAEK